jgi:hypothetical protein
MEISIVWEGRNKETTEEDKETPPTPNFLPDIPKFKHVQLSTKE